MMLSQAHFHDIGLKDEDFAVFMALQNTSRSVSDLARAVLIPRTSLVRPLKRLHDRKMIRKYTVGNRVMWKAISETELAEKIHASFPSKSQPQKGIISLNTHTDLVATYKSMLDLPTKYPIYAIQSNESMASVLKHYPLKQLEELNKGIKEKRLIVHAILEEDVIARFGTLIEKQNHPTSELYQSVHGRSAVTRYVPQNTFSSSAEVWAWNGTVLIANWQKGTGVVIHDENIYLFVIELIRLFEEITRSVDQNPMLSKLAEINHE